MLLFKESQYIMCIEIFKGDFVMYDHLMKYRVTPRVVPAESMATIKIEGTDESTRLFDDVEYKIEIIAKEEWEYNKEGEHSLFNRNNTAVLNLYPENGVITLNYEFKGEQEWRVVVKPVECDAHIPQMRKELWPWLIDGVYCGFDFRIYSLKEDLYCKKPFKGDLHMHSYDSDGWDSSAFMAAQYRKFGYDFICLTDHYRYDPSVKLIEYIKNINTAFKVFPGEEVHPKKEGGVYHLVNFGGKASVNDRYYSNPEKAEAEVKEIEKTLDILDDRKRHEVAFFKWICDAIRETGGIAIYPHPFWVIIDSYNVNNSTTDELFKRRIFDVFEIMGGTDKKHNRMQVEYYNSMQRNGYKFPIVASSDAHSAREHNNSHFDQCFTVAFAENTEKIFESVKNGLSVAVDNFEVSDQNVYGDFRLVKYTWFLLENYFENHDELCQAIGLAMRRYAAGDKNQNTLICMLENELKKYVSEFFGIG